MKKPNQVRKSNRTARESAQEQQRGEVEVKVCLPARTIHVLEARAASENVTVSGLMERAIRTQLPTLESLAETVGQNDHRISARIKDEILEGQRVRDNLENAIYRGGALLETLAALVAASENSVHPLLSESAVGGLQMIALEYHIGLRESFDHYTARLRSSNAVAA